MKRARRTKKETHWQPEARKRGKIAACRRGDESKPRTKRIIDVRPSREASFDSIFSIDTDVYTCIPYIDIYTIIRVTILRSKVEGRVGSDIIKIARGDVGKGHDRDVALRGFLLRWNRERERSYGDICVYISTLASYCFSIYFYGLPFDTRISFTILFTFKAYPLNNSRYHVIIANWFLQKICYYV